MVIIELEIYFLRQVRSPFNLGSCNYRYGKTGNRKRATCYAALQQNELNNDVARFATHSKPFFQQIRLFTGLNIGSKTRNIAVQLVLQQFCITSCTFVRVARFSVLKENWIRNVSFLPEDAPLSYWPTFLPGDAPLSYWPTFFPGDAPLSYWPNFFPVRSNNPRSLCKS